MRPRRPTSSRVAVGPQALPESRRTPTPAPRRGTGHRARPGGSAVLYPNGNARPGGSSSPASGRRTSWTPTRSAPRRLPWPGNALGGTLAWLLDESLPLTSRSRRAPSSTGSSSARTTPGAGRPSEARAPRSSGSSSSTATPTWQRAPSAPRGRRVGEPRARPLERAARTSSPPSGSRTAQRRSRPSSST